MAVARTTNGSKMKTNKDCGSTIPTSCARLAHNKPCLPSTTRRSQAGQRCHHRQVGPNTTGPETVSGDGDRVSTVKGCGVLLLLYLAGSVVTGVIIGLTFVGVV